MQFKLSYNNVIPLRYYPIILTGYCRSDGSSYLFIGINHYPIIITGNCSSDGNSWLLNANKKELSFKSKQDLEAYLKSNEFHIPGFCF